MELTNFNKDKKARRKAIPDLSSMMYGKVPPQAKELEEAVLGAIMLEKSAFDTVVEILKPECFYSYLYIYLMARIFVSIVTRGRSVQSLCLSLRVPSTQNGS